VMTLREPKVMNKSLRSISTKLAMASAALIIAILSIGTVGINALSTLERNVNQIVNVSVKKLQLGERIQQDLLKMTRAGKNIITAPSEDQMDGYAALIEQTHSNLIQRLDLIQALSEQEDSDAINKFRQKLTEYMAVDNKVLEYSRLNSNVQAKNISATSARKAFDNAEAALRNIVTVNEKIAESYKEQSAGAQLKVVHGTQIKNDMLLILRAERNIILSTNVEEMREYADRIEALQIDLFSNLTSLRKLTTEDGTSKLDKFTRTWDRWSDVYSRVLELALLNSNLRANNNQVRELSRENINRRAFDLAAGEGRQLADEAGLQMDIIVKRNVELSTQSTELLAMANDRLLVASRMIQDMLAIHRAAKSLILEKTQAGMDVFSDSIERFKVDLQAKLNRLKTLAGGDELYELELFEQSWSNFLAVNEQVLVLSRQNSNQFALDLTTGKGRELADQAEAIISDLVAESESSLATERDQSSRVYDESILVILVTLTLSTIMGGGFSFLMIHMNIRSTEKNDQAHWIKTGQAEMADVMGGGLKLDELSRSIITTLAKYLGASVGVIYLANDDDTYTQTGSYAFSSHKYASKTIKAGEGTVGQAILDANTIMVSELPDDYIEINSGLGEAVPRHLMVVPLRLEDSVTGAVEIGSFEPFTALQIEFAELVSDAIAIAVRAGQNQERVSRLLEESQTQSEELLAQQEELRSSNEELQEKTESLEKQKTEIEENNVSIMQAQTELEEKAHELELSSTYKSQFLANMSHELRTPLNSMLLLSKSLMADRNGNLHDEQIEDAKIIYEGGQALLNLINDIMDLSKIEAGMLTVIDELVELEPLSAGLQRLFDPVATSKNLKFEVDITDTAPESINTDGQRLEQILKNFLSNAFKFTKTGKVILRISLHDPSTDSGLNKLNNKDLLVISVIDTGIGIPRNKQQLVFDAFEQVDGTTSRKHGGTGLGLSISRELTDLLGGEILLKSNEGEGSSFSLYLPLNAERGSETKEIQSAGQQQTSTARSGLVTSALELRPTPYITDDRNQIVEGDQTILIIEDDRDFAEALMDMVRSSGYKCLAAADGRSGLYLATQFQLRGILLDMGLPGMDGLEVIRRLKYQARTARAPIYVISGYDREGEVVASGVTGYLQKPATKEDIESALSDIGRLSLENIPLILVIEDNQDTQRAIASLFRGSNTEFAFASNGKDACTYIESQQFDCIILDLKLPDMSGFDILKKVSWNSEVVLPPIIIYTGRQLTDEENVYLAKFTSSIIVKGPESPERLIDEVAMFLHSDLAKGQSEGKQQVGMLHNDDILFRDRTILLVDDDMRNLYALSRELQQLGLDVLIAENGQVALDKLNENPSIELVLMDIMMPVMDGYQAMRKIRGISKFSELPVIALTAKAMPEDRAFCIDAGASEYITKPINVEILKSMLRVWLFERIEFGG